MGAPVYMRRRREVGRRDIGATIVHPPAACQGAATTVLRVIVSAGVFALPGDGTQAAGLAAAAKALRPVFDRVRGPVPAGLSTKDHEGAIRSWSFADGVVSVATWAEAVAGLGTTVDSTIATAGETRAAVEAGEGSRPPAVRLVVDERDGDALDAAATEALGWVRSAAASAAVVTGFVAVDTGANPFEQRITRFMAQRSTAYDRHAIGYPWAVVLTAGHLAALGGRDRVVAEAPVAVVEEVAGDRVLCVLTDRPTSLDEATVRAWREFLLPVLCLGPVRSSQPGEAEPRWLFEGTPVPAGTRVPLQRPASQPRRGSGRPAVAPVEGLRSTAVTVVVAWAAPPTPDEAARWAAIVAAWTWAGRTAGLGDEPGRFASTAAPVLRPDGIEVEVDVGTVPAAVALEHLSRTLDLSTRELGTTAVKRFGTISAR